MKLLEMLSRSFRYILSSIGGFLHRSRVLFANGIRDAGFHNVILWCLPALIVGFALRAWLTWEMPWGYFQFDSKSFVLTGVRLAGLGKFEINSKRSFLVPVLYSIPFLLHVPALLVIPFAQHVLGLIQITFAGIVVRLWFVRWRLAIIPATLWLAVCPWILWFEHALMSEALTLFFLLADLLLGTLWVKTRRNEFFVLLLISLLLTAGTRGEARFYYLFAVLLVLAVLGLEWKALKPLLLGIGGCLVVTMAMGKTNISASSYLFASLVHLSPDRFVLVPGIEPYITPLRDRYRAKWTQFPADTVQASKDISNATNSFLKAQNPSYESKQISSTLNRMSLEILVRRPLTVFSYPFVKTRMAIDSWGSVKLDRFYLHQKQQYALKDDGQTLPLLTAGLIGKSLTSSDLNKFIQSHYSPDRVRWFDKWGSFWNNSMIAFRFPDSDIKQQRWAHDYIPGIPGGLNRMPGWPIFYLVSLIGIVTAMLFKHPQRATIVTWGISLLTVWYAAQMIGNATARYRFAYEPFLWIYILLLFDRLAMLIPTQK